jgi:3-hydroxypropanoate dehydrogenase
MSAQPSQHIGPIHPSVKTGAVSETHVEAVAVCKQRLFFGARTHAHWLPKPVSTDLLYELVRLVQCGPTSMNTQPLRIQFVVSEAAKEQLVACVNAGNVAKTRSAPVVAILGQDLAFPERLPVLFAHKTDARSYYEGKPDFTASTALRNSSLQGGYLILAARLLGLDCGPMSGFDAAAVDKAFWGGTAVRSNFLCNLGYGDATQLKPRPPRLGFEDVCRIV